MADQAIRKRTDQVIKSEKNIYKAKETLKSQCTHTINGEPTLVPSNGPKTEGELKYLCKQCQKLITIASIPEEELEQACETIDRAIDIIKIATGNARSEEELEIIHKLSKVQYRARNEIVPVYRASLKKGNRNQNRQNRNNGGDNGAWGRPTVHGR